MCKILSPTVLELVKFFVILAFCVESAEQYAHEVIWEKLYNSLGTNISKYVDDWSMLVIAISIEEDETEISFIEQAIQCFFYKGLDNSYDITIKRQKIEDKLMELFRAEILSDSAEVQSSQITDIHLNLVHNLVHA